MPTGSKPGGATRRAKASVHLHQPLIAEHDLLIGGQDQRLFSGNEMRQGADVATGFEEAWRPINSGCSVPRARCRRYEIPEPEALRLRLTDVFA